MTFAEYLKTRRRAYTEGAYLLRQEIVAMPDTVQSRPEVYAWLRERGANLQAQDQARIAWRSYVDYLSGSNRKVKIVRY